MGRGRGIIRISRRINYLRSIFPFDFSSGSFTIEITIDHYDEIFNEWDPSPFRRRDIHPDLRNYLDYCSQEIPLKFPIQISIEVPPEKRNPTAEKMVEQGIKNDIQMSLFQLKRTIGKSNAIAVFEMIGAFFFLFIAYYLKAMTIGDALFQAIVEGISIWGWVLEWQGILTFFFTKSGFRKQTKQLARYLRAQIVFKDQKVTFTASSPALIKKRTLLPRASTVPPKKKRKLPTELGAPHVTPLKRKKR